MLQNELTEFLEYANCRAWPGDSNEAMVVCKCNFP